MVAHARSRRGGEQPGLPGQPGPLRRGALLRRAHRRGLPAILPPARRHAVPGPDCAHHSGRQRDRPQADGRGRLDPGAGHPGSRSIARSAGSPSRPNTASVSIFRSSSTSSFSIPAPKRPSSPMGRRPLRAAAVGLAAIPLVAAAEGVDVARFFLILAAILVGAKILGRAGRADRAAGRPGRAARRSAPGRQRLGRRPYRWRRGRR